MGVRPGEMKREWKRGRDDGHAEICDDDVGIFGFVAEEDVFGSVQRHEYRDEKSI